MGGSWENTGGEGGRGTDWVSIHAIATAAAAS